MKNTQEFDGKNIEEAIDNACSSLNIAKKNLVYDVISSGSTGIFGIVGVKKARIRVTLPKSYVQNVQKNNQAVDTSEMDGIMSIVDEAFGQKPEKSKETEPNPLPRKEPKAEAPEPEKTEARKPSPRKHAPRKTWKKKHQPATAATAAPEEIEEIEEIEEEITVEAAEDVASIDTKMKSLWMLPMRASH